MKNENFEEIEKEVENFNNKQGDIYDGKTGNESDENGNKNPPTEKEPNSKINAFGSKISFEDSEKEKDSENEPIKRKRGRPKKSEQKPNETNEKQVEKEIEKIDEKEESGIDDNLFGFLDSKINVSNKNDEKTLTKTKDGRGRPRKKKVGDISGETLVSFIDMIAPFLMLVVIKMIDKKGYSHLKMSDFKATKEEKEEMIPFAALVAEKYLDSMNPTWGLAFVVLMSYGSKVAEIEKIK